MKTLKLFGWALLGLFVLFLVLIIIVAVLDYTTDDMEVRTIERTTQPITEDCISLFCAYLDKENGVPVLEELLSGITDTDIILLQNCEESYIEKLGSLFESHNGYFSFSKRSPVSISSNGKVSFMDFSGLYSLSAYSPLKVRKLLLSTDINWFYFLLSSMPSTQILEFQNNGKQLFIINLDNVMNDQWESEDINRTRLEYIKTSIIETLPQDGYFVIAGNWQNLLPGQIITEEKSFGKEIPLDWTKTGWQWVYPPKETIGYGVLASGNVQIKEISFLEMPSKQSPQAISFHFYLE
ncbi:MAG: hypothetical protein U9N62_13570 [Thermotogota bacterium]|nr:hypothetical protein [Thermotogota bacterium]